MDALRQFGIRPNAHGFIADFAAARQVADYAENGTGDPEPELWLPWLVVRYPLG